MAIDKALDSAGLDAGLTSVADAIRTKGGTSAPLAFPAGFVSAINGIGDSGDYTASDWLDAAKPAGAIVYNGTAAPPSMAGRTGSFSVSMPNVTQLSANWHTFMDCSGMTALSAPNLVEFKLTWTCARTTSWTGGAFFPKAIVPSSCFRGSRISSLVCLRTATSASNTNDGNTNLAAYDQLGNYALNGLSNFNGCTSLGVIVLRATSVIPLGNINNFTNTKFWSGKAGGDIYIPKTLYDALGTGTNDYKAASNWSTIDGYGKTTWHAIEGSYYETHYADGTAIPTT